jgi:hypothetical protein
MSLNGIAHLPTKAERQVAKLALAAADRAADGNARSTYDITELPTVYSTASNNTNLVIDNPNVGGLIYGRPWISSGTPEPLVISPDLLAGNETIDLHSGNSVLDLNN